MRAVLSRKTSCRLESVLEVKNLLLEHLYHKPALNADEIFRKPL